MTKTAMSRSVRASDSIKLLVTVRRETFLYSPTQTVLPTRAVRSRARKIQDSTTTKTMPLEEAQIEAFVHKVGCSLLFMLTRYCLPVQLVVVNVTDRLPSQRRIHTLTETLRIFLSNVNNWFLLQSFFLPFAVLFSQHFLKQHAKN